jgi:hypothetical protein
MKLTTPMLASVLCAVVACTAHEADQPESTAEATASSDPSRPLPSPFPEVVARINGQPIRFIQIVPLARRELASLPEENRAAGRPAAVRRALERYIDRELLFQEAQARGLTVDQRRVEWAYDQARQEFTDDSEWEAFLAEEGLDPGSLRTEIRIQQMVGALLEAEAASSGTGEVKSLERVASELATRLRASARIESYL